MNDVYEKYADSTSFVAISDSNRHPRLHYAATIHHGIDTAAFGVPESHGDHLLFFGRIHPDKGTAEAIAVARAAGRRLVIAGIVQDDDYFRRAVLPHIDGVRVHYVGAVSSTDRAAVLGDSYALLHLIGFDEPFGFSVVEAMACGTPVVAYDRGSMRELIVDGVTGYLVDGLDGAVAAVHDVATLDRHRIRELVVERFEVRRMVRQYAELYEQVLPATALGR